MNDIPPFSSQPRYASPPSASAESFPAGPQVSVRLTRLLVVLGALMVMLILPSFVKRVRYASEYGRQRARMDVALDGLGELKLENLSLASRWVAQAVGPSVVHISTRRPIPHADPVDEYGYFFGPRPRDELEGRGSGVIVDDKGFILTNNHVIHGASEIDVLLSDGRQLSAHVIGTDPLTDIAVVRIQATDLAAAQWGDSEQLETGDLVWAVGSPFGLSRSVTFGIVSAKSRPEISSQFQDFLQTDAAVNPGNSGGPLVNIRGEIVGINTAIVGTSYQGISFAIPSRIAEDVYQRLKSEGHVGRGWLGVKLQVMTAEMAPHFELDRAQGALVGHVFKGSPAELGKLQAGDVVVQWNNEEVAGPTALSRLVAKTEIGSQAQVGIIRDGQSMTIDIVVDQRPSPEQLRKRGLGIRN